METSPRGGQRRQLGVRGGRSTRDCGPLHVLACWYRAQIALTSAQPCPLPDFPLLHFDSEVSSARRASGHAHRARHRAAARDKTACVRICGKSLSLPPSRRLSTCAVRSVMFLLEIQQTGLPYVTSSVAWSSSYTYTHTRPRPHEDRYPKITTRPCFLPLHSVAGQSRSTNLLGGVAGFSLPVIHFVSPMAAVGPLQCHHPRDDESRVISLNSTTCLLNVYLLFLPLYACERGRSSLMFCYYCFRVCFYTIR